MHSSEIILQGNFLSLFGVGTLITGEPGIGKSELSLALLDRQHQLIADDSPHFSRVNNKLYGRNPMDRPFLMVRGIGLLDVLLLFGAASIKPDHELNLVIHLESGPEKEINTSLEGQHSSKDILGCLIPCTTIPIITPRNLVMLVETVVKNHLLKAKEICSVTNFEELLRKKMEISPL